MLTRSLAAVALFVIAALFLALGSAQETPDASVTADSSSNDDRSSEAESSGRSEVAASVLESAGLIQPGAVKLVARVIDETIDQARRDQDRVHSAIRRVNENVIRLLASESNAQCDRIERAYAPSPKLLRSRYIRRHPELLAEWADKPWVLAHPVVIAHPEVLTYAAVKQQPKILDYPAAMHYPSVLDLVPLRTNPSILLAQYGGGGGQAVGRGDGGVESASEVDSCLLFVQEIRRINEFLLIESYSDSIRQNSNLSEQLTTRLDALVEDSETLSSQVEREQFLQEYSLLMNRFLDSKQFRIGLGAVYSYLPTVRYDGAERVDVSQFQSVAPGGADRLLFGADFSNQGFVSVLLTAKAPFFDIDFLYPDVESKTTMVTPVHFYERDTAGTQLLTQSSVSSTLKIEYDAGIRVGLGRLLERRRTRTALKLENELGPYYPKSTRGRFDWGLGIGVTGFRVENVINTDVRSRNDDTTVFNDLASSGTVPSSNRSTFESVYLSGYYKFKVNDELEVGIDYRRHDTDHDDGGRITLGGETMQLTIAYYPTLGRRQMSLQRLQESLEKVMRDNADATQPSGSNQQ